MKNTVMIILLLLCTYPNMILSFYNQLRTGELADTIIAKEHEQLGQKYLNTNQDTARIHFLTAIKIFSNFKKFDRVANLNKFVGIAFAMQGHIDSAILYMKESLKYYHEIKDSLNIAFTYNNIGLVYTTTGNMKKA